MNKIRQYITEELPKQWKTADYDLTPDDIKKELKKWKYNTVVLTSKDKNLEMYSYTRPGTMEIYHEGGTVEILGNGARMMLLQDRDILAVKAKPMRSIIFVTRNGWVIIQRS